GKSHLVGLGIDITARKQTEVALRESEEKYRSIMESMKDAVYITSKEFRIEYMNPKMISRISRNATGELCYKAIYDNDTKCSWCAIDRICAGEHVMYELENPTDNRFYNFTDSPVCHANGKISKLTVSRDITDSKTMEEQLRQAHKMDAIGTLASGIAHQFNNALYTVTGNINLLEEDFHNDERVTDFTKEIKSSAARMTRLTSQLLAYARGGKYEAKTISLTSFVKETFPLVKHSIAPAINIETDLPRDTLNVKVDLTQMQMVLSAVLSNASEAMEGKGGHILLSVGNETITDEKTSNLPDIKPGNYACLTTIDNGKGM
ncbi:MAG: hypothetical protein GY845_38285, partial [Planctomycetes bacterium]|nr:hypothetical protein [Planctomycetota bacterium]